MCGIVGYVGKGEAVPILIDGLRRLEYRGYDSAGVAYRNGNGIEVYKAEGKIRNLESILPADLRDVHIGLGHTRWATHGVPSDRNAHPHRAGCVAVVHNGIIENYHDLKADLSRAGASFQSETDTEVIPQLIMKYLNGTGDIREAIGKTLSKLKGTYALGILCESSGQTIFAARKGSPLVIGLGDGECFFASDVPAILPYTRKVIFLQDDELCAVRADCVEIENLRTGRKDPIDGRITEITWTASMTEKEGFDHFILKEIFEQPRAVMDTFGEWMEKPERLLEELGLDMKTSRDPARIHIVACGTSYHAAIFGKYIIERIVRIPVDVDIASEYRYRSPIIEKGTIFISITQSGETADTLAAQREAKRRGARTINICNAVGSTSTREADSVLYTRAGPEIGVASTKAFTSQLAALCLVATALAMKKGKMTPAKVTLFRSLLLDIPGLIQKTLKCNSRIGQIASTLGDPKGFLYLGRGINYPIALEGALKMKELSYIHAEGYPAGEMKHGPIALIEKGHPVVVLATVDDLFGKILSNIEEVRARGGRVIAVTDAAASLKQKAHDIIEVPTTHPCLFPFVDVIPLQLLAYHVAAQRGHDVDQPRNLAKSVTVE